MKRFFSALAVLLCLGLIAAPALAINVVQSTGYYASDFASVLSGDAKNHIEVNAKALDDATGAQIVFVTMRTTSPNAIDDYAYALFNAWGIGDAKKNNGILVLLAIGDDNYYTMEGSGLERNLPTSDLSALWNEYLEPDFADKKYSEASVKYFDALFEKVADIYGANLAIDNTSSASYYGSGGSTDGSNFTSNGATDGDASRAAGDEGGFGGVSNFLIAVAIVIIVLSFFGGVRGGCGCLPGLFGGWLGGSMFGSRRRRPPGPGPWGGPRRPGGFGGGGFGGGSFGGGSFGGGGGRTRGSGGGRSGGGGFGGGGFGGGGGFSGGGGGSRGAGGGRGR